MGLNGMTRIGSLFDEKEVGEGEVRKRRRGSEKEEKGK